MIDRIGVRFDELDGLEIACDPTSAFPHRRHSRSVEWWTTTNAEEHFLDIPPFASAQDRARYMVREMGRAALAQIPGATADDPLFELDGRPASLNDLLASVDRDVVDELLDRMDDDDAS